MIIDVHTHIVPEQFPDYLGTHQEQRWPSMCACETAGHKAVTIAGKTFREVTTSSWDAALRLADMDSEGVAKQALSPMPELLSYWFSADDGLTMSRYTNETIAGMVAVDPDRFFGLGMVPLQDPELAAKEMASLKKEYGLQGIEVGSNVNGTPIGDPKFEPVFAAAVEHDLAIFVHALHPAGMDRVVGPPIMAALVAFPNENAFAVASVISGGLLDKYPDVRIGFSHCGGSFGLVLPRMMHGWRGLGDKLLPKSPLEYARTLYYDTLVYDLPTLNHLRELFGDSQLMVGSDYPFVIRERSPGHWLDDLNLSDEQRHQLSHGNAERFLGVG